MRLREFRALSPAECAEQADWHPKGLIALAAPASDFYKPETINMGTILLIVLILLLVGALPTWPYSTGWGYYPSGGLGLVVVILLILVLMGRI